MFHCLPSQLEKEDSKVIQETIIIENEIRQQQDDENRRAIAEARLKGMMH